MEFVMSCIFAGLAGLLFSMTFMRNRARKLLWRRGGAEGDLSTFKSMRSAVKARCLNPQAQRRLGVASAMLGALWGMLVLPGHTFFAALTGAILGAVLPTLIRRAAARKRREGIEIALPGALDWLALSVEAGEGFAQALSRIAPGLPAGPLKDELLRLCAEVGMGATRREALSAMARRAGSPDLSAVVALLIQADLLGARMGPMLRLSSRRLRAKRLARAERRGAAAAQKALLPLTVCIMPATLVVVFGPLIARLATGGIEAFF